MSIKKKILLTFNTDPYTITVKNHEIVRFVRAGNDLGVDFVKVGGSRLNSILNSNLPTAAINMTGKPIYAHVQYLRDLELRGVRVLNSIFDSNVADDKLLSYIELKNAGFPVPKTMYINPLFLENKKLLIEWISDNLSWPCVLKITNASLGRGIIRINSPADFDDIFGLLNVMSLRTFNGDNDSNLLIQEYIKETEGKTIRVIVLNNQCIGSYMKLSYDHWKANSTSGSFDRKPFELTSELSKLSLAVCKKFNLGYAGVDFLISKNGFLVGEINTSAMLQGFDITHPHINIYPMIIKYLIE